MSKKVGKNEHHLWKKRDSTGSGQKALNLVRIVSLYGHVLVVHMLISANLDHLEFLKKCIQEGDRDDMHVL